MQGRTSRIRPIKSHARSGRPSLCDHTGSVTLSAFFLEPRLHLSKSKLRLLHYAGHFPGLGIFQVPCSRPMAGLFNRRTVPPNAGESAVLGRRTHSNTASIPTAAELCCRVRVTGEASDP